MPQNPGLESPTPVVVSLKISNFTAFGLRGKGDSRSVVTYIVDSSPISFHGYMLVGI